MLDDECALVVIEVYAPCSMKETRGDDSVTRSSVLSNRLYCRTEAMIQSAGNGPAESIKRSVRHPLGGASRVPATGRRVSNVLSDSITVPESAAGEYSFAVRATFTGPDGAGRHTDRVDCSVYVVASPTER